MIIELATIAGAGVVGYIIRGFVTKWDDDDENSKLVMPMSYHNALAKTKKLSEPVTSFIRLLKENPRRFSFDSEYTCHVIGRSSTTIYEVADHKLNKVFKVECRSSRHCSIYTGLGEISWITKDECEEVISTIENYQSERREKLTAIKQQRSRRNLMKIYNEDSK